MTELAGVEVEVQTEQTGIESKKVQTHKDAEACVCKKDVAKNEMVMKKDKMICLFKRVECSEDEWEEVEDTVAESGIGLEDMLDQWAKVMEGYQRVENRKD